MRTHRALCTIGRCQDGPVEHRADGKISKTTAILINAPRAISEHRALIKSTSEYRPTPKVAAKKPSAETITDFAEVSSAM